MARISKVLERSDWAGFLLIILLTPTALLYLLSKRKTEGYLASLALNMSPILSPQQDYNGHNQSLIRFLPHSPRMLNYTTVSCTKVKYDIKSKITRRQSTVKLLGYDPKDLINYFDHAVSRISYQRSGVLVTVMERYRGKWSLGGSSFRGIVSSSSGLAACSSKDYLNGTYVLKCPLYAKCQHVNITVLHVDYSQFLGITRRLDHTVLETDLCAPDRRMVAHEPPQNIWIPASAGTWRWHTNDVDYPLRHAAFCVLVDSFSHLYTIGSSHMKFQYLYITRYCRKYVKDIKKKLHHTDVLYVSMLADYIPKLKNISYDHNKCHVVHGSSKSSRLPTKAPQCKRTKVGVLIQIGSWDLSYSDFGLLINKHLPELGEVLRNITEFTSDVFRVLVMGPPPFYSVLQYSQCRNDEMIQIFANGLGKLCKNNGVRYLNVFDIIYPRFNEVMPNDHYLYCKDGQNTCSGEVGKIITQIAIKALADGT